MISRQIQLSYEHRALFTEHVFDPANPALRDLIAPAREPEGQPSKMLFFLDAGLAAHDASLPDRIRAYAAAHRDVLALAAPPEPLPGGEACKNDWSKVEHIWKAIHDHEICRHSYIVAVGGGALLDLVGFAAATAHRGVRHIRMPTTTLSQGDGGVGVKNGVNFFGKKNWVGSFAIPFAVINDATFLDSLPAPDRRAGIIEAIKVALIRDRAFFHEMEAQRDELARLEPQALRHVIRRSAELHMNHIARGGDPFELGSARPLDFGHWAAHKLEQISEFRIGHGEAVALGMTIDLIYARRQGLLPADTERRILCFMEAVGFRLFDPHLLAKSPQDGKLAVLRGLEEFREHLGGELTITLVTGIGEAREVHLMDETEIPAILTEMEARFAPAPHRNRNSQSRPAR